MPDDLASVEDHLERILAAVGPLSDAELPLMDALGLVCTHDVVSPLSLPRFDNSAMDGYAVRQRDVATATAASPVVLPVVGQIGAGQAGVRTLEPGAVAKIMTGAPVPEGADAIVPYEWTDRGSTEARITDAPRVRQHVRSAGEDVTEGDLLFPAGTLLSPRDVGLLASVGLASVRVRPRPRVVIISTGSELRDPGSDLDHDSIYDGNSYLLAAAAHRAGAVAHRVGIVADRPEAFLEALRRELADADLVVTSGGVSQGDFDVVKAALRPLGTMWFGGVAMQPGKPQGFGLVDATPIFTLPGNPVSSYISFELFVRPALRTLMGITPVETPTAAARLAETVTSPAGRRQFLRGTYAVGPDGPVVTPVGGAGSHLVGDLAASDALIVVPEDATSITAGALVSVVRLDQEG
ncbi:MAG: gephyrin-like molybdotransferase Glp [Nocardioides sp.]